MSPATRIRCHVVGMGADETIERRASIQPNDIEEIEWPLEDINMTVEDEEIFFKVRIEYSDIFNGERWVQADFFVKPEFDFPTTFSIHHAAGLDGDVSTMANPSHITERKIQFRYYSDDLQEEAREYAKANQPA